MGTLTDKLKGFTTKVVLPIALGIGLSCGVSYGYTAKPNRFDKIEDVNKIEIYKKVEGKLLKIVYVRKGKFIKIITLLWK